MEQLPKMATCIQSFPRPVLQNLAGSIRASLGGLPPSLIAGKSIAVAVGSRGIADLRKIVQSIIESLRELGAKPYIVPAMGSHGGATAEGQREVLRHFGISEESLNVPIRSSLETVRVGETPAGIPVQIDREALNSDGILLVNRIKPHTDFKGSVESGLQKMIAVGLGNIEGARDFHTAVEVHPHEEIIRGKASVLLSTGKIMAGVAILENAYHETARVEVLPAARIQEAEPALLESAKALMPSLPFDELDLLVVDRIGKDISGTGMDPNITGRWFHGSCIWQETPRIRRIAVLDLSEATRGNALGIGMADFCHFRVVEKMDRETTYRNVITSQNTQNAHIPMYFDSDREVLRRALASLGSDVSAATVRVARIRDTLSLENIEVSEALLPLLSGRNGIRQVSDGRPIEFDGKDNLITSLHS